MRLVTKKRKRKKKKIRKLPIIWVCGLFLYIAMSIFGTSYNTTLLTEISNQEDEIKLIQERVNILKHQVNVLSSRDRIVQLVEKEGLESAPDRIINTRR